MSFYDDYDEDIEDIGDREEGYEDEEESREEKDDWEEGEYEAEEEIFSDIPEGFEEMETIIDMGPEKYNYADSKVDPTRTGVARRADIDEDLGTMIGGSDKQSQKMNRLNRQLNRTPEDTFRQASFRVIERKNLERFGLKNDIMSLASEITRQKRGLKYRNPKCMVYASMAIENTVINKLDEVYDNYASKDGVSKGDLLRYAFFIVETRKNMK
jgi:hypothetical protein